MEIRLSRAQIRDRLRARLGLPPEPTVTISDKADEVLSRLGMADVAAAGATRAILRASLYDRAGESAVGGAADTTVNELLIAANRWAVSRCKWLMLGSDLASDGATSEADGELVLCRALADYAAQAQDAATAKTWEDRASARLKALMLSVESSLIDSWLDQAARQPFADDEAQVMDACASACAFLGRGDEQARFAKLVQERQEQKRTADNLALNEFILAGAQEAYSRWPWVRMAREATIAVTAGTPVVTLPVGVGPDNLLDVGWWQDGDQNFTTLRRAPVPVSLRNDLETGYPTTQADRPQRWMVQGQDVVAGQQGMRLWPIPSAAGSLLITHNLHVDYAADVDVLEIDAGLILAWAAAQWCLTRGKDRLAGNFAEEFERRGAALARNQHRGDVIRPGERTEAALALGGDVSRWIYDNAGGIRHIVPR